MHLGDLIASDAAGTLRRIDALTGHVHHVFNSSSPVSALAVTDVPPPGWTYCYGFGCPCGNSDPLAGCATSTGHGALLRAAGTASVAADDLLLFTTSAPASQFGILYMGDGHAWIPLGDGVLCSGGGSHFRYPVTQTDPAGFNYQTGVVGHSASNFGAGGQLVAGGSWSFQLWFRDPGGPCGSRFNMTNGCSVTFLP